VPIASIEIYFCHFKLSLLLLLLLLKYYHLYFSVASCISSSNF